MRLLSKREYTRGNIPQDQSKSCKASDDLDLDVTKKSLMALYRSKLMQDLPRLQGVENETPTFDGGMEEEHEGLVHL